MSKSREIEVAASLTALIEQAHKMNDHEKYVLSMAIVENIKVVVMQLIEESRA